MVKSKNLAASGKKAAKRAKQSKKKVIGRKARQQYEEVVPIGEVAAFAEEHAKLVQERLNARINEAPALGHLPQEMRKGRVSRLSAGKNARKKKLLRNAIRYMTPRDSRKLLGLNPKRHKRPKTTAGH